MKCSSMWLARRSLLGLTLILSLAIAPKQGFAADVWTKKPDIPSPGYAPAHTNWMGGTGVNLAIVPRDSATSLGQPINGRSMIMWYSDDDDNGPVNPDLKHGGAWLFTPPLQGTEGAATDDSWHDDVFQLYPSAEADLGYGAFCSGMGILSNGDFYSIGGTTELEDGSDTSAVYHRNRKTVDHSVMNNRRWYAGGVKLPDGKMLISSGSLYKQIRTIGGENTFPNALYRCGVERTPSWDYVTPNYSSLNKPSFVHGHGVATRVDADVYYGGINPSGQLLNEAYFLYTGYDDARRDYQVSWVKRPPAAGNSAPKLAYHFITSLPADSAMVANGFPNKDITIMIGGVYQDPNAPTSTPAPTANIYWGYLDGSGNYIWNTIDLSHQLGLNPGEAPLARYGHAAQLLKSTNSTVFLFGGSASLNDPGTGGSVTDTCVYAMQLTSKTSALWAKCKVQGQLVVSPNVTRTFSTAPNAKVFASSGIHKPEHAECSRILLFGGLDLTSPVDAGSSGSGGGMTFGQPSGTASSDLYSIDIVSGFYRNSTGELVAPVIRWYKMSPTGYNAPLAAKFLAGSALSTNSDELWIQGGLPAGPAGMSPSPVPTTFAIVDTAVYNPGYRFVQTWRPKTAAPVNMWGQATKFFDSDYYIAQPEVFNPVTGSYSSVTELATAGTTPFKLFQDWYPHMHVLPWGVSTAGSRPTWTLFNAGPGAHSYLMEIDTTSSPQARLLTNGRVIDPDPLHPEHDNVYYNKYAADPDFRGGTTVMYRPGKFLRLGSRDTDSNDKGSSASNTALILDLSTARPATTPQWTKTNDMPYGRVDHNATILADGTVLVTGGLQYYGNDHNEYATLDARRPMIWNPTTGTWTGGPGSPLTPNWNHRGYHSSTILLCDGRVISTGGNATTDITANTPQGDFGHQLMADVYSPPYLFTPTGAPAVRPVIGSASKEVSFGSNGIAGAITVTMSNASGTAAAQDFALVAPGAATHAYDENQRYIHLDSTPVGGDGLTYTLTLPYPHDATVAPQGYYMLFALSASGVPSIATWVHIGWPLHPTRISDLYKNCVEAVGSTFTAHVIWTQPVQDTSTTSNAAKATAAASAYLMRVSTSTPSEGQEWNWFASATDVMSVKSLVPTAPGSGTWQSADVTNLTHVSGPPTKYSIQMIASSSLDAQSLGKDAPCWSALSNLLTVYVASDECGYVDGGGDPGGDPGIILHRASRTYVKRPGGSGTGMVFDENTLLPNVATGVHSRDAILLPYGPVWTDSTGLVRVSRTGLRGTRVDSLFLVEVNHAAGEDAFVRSGEYVSGTLSNASAITKPDGADIASALAATGRWSGEPGDTLYVDIGPGPSTIAIQTKHAHLVLAPDITGIQVQSLSGSNWTDCGHCEVRDKSATALYDVPSGNHVRLVFLGDHTLERVARFVPGGGVTVTRHLPSSGSMSGTGDVTEQLRSSGVVVAAGSQLFANFADAHPGDMQTQDWFLEVSGTHTPPGVTNATAAQRDPSTVALPLRFVLEQNAPNPFSSRASMRFGLPSARTVRMELFDMQGRRVRVLAAGRFEAGWHSVALDRQQDRGSRIPAGVYLCVTVRSRPS